MATKTRYNDEELEEFRVIINEKLKLARRDYEAMMRTLMTLTILHQPTKYWRRVVPHKAKKN